MQSYSIVTILQAIKVDSTLIKKFWSGYSLGYIAIEGLLPANDIRKFGFGKPCACCGQIMTRDRRSQTPIKGWLWVGSGWQNPRNVTIDHRYPKSLFPELMFDSDNMELMCLMCNQDKGDLFGQTISIDCKYHADRLRSKLL